MTHPTSSDHRPAVFRVPSCFAFLRPLLGGALALLAGAVLAAEPAKKNFDVPGGDAAATLKQFVEQSGEEVIYLVNTVRGVATKSVSGKLTAREAIDRMLTGTELVVMQDEKTGALTVNRTTDPNADRAAPTPRSDRPKLEAKTSGDAAPAPAEGGVVKLEAFSVTGSNIKRVDQEKVLPVTVFNRDAMDVRNATTPVEMLTALPQVTNVPLNESAAGGTTARGDNANVNLRGIGSGNTLILLNGRRLAPHPVTSQEAGALSFSVNVNQLPTQGIEHIDVLRDGASSIYGSDAVAGVINYITRKDFRGTDVRVRYTQPEHGGGATSQGTFTYGRDFSGGRLRWLTTADFLYRDALYLRDRSYTANANHSASAPAPFNVPGSAFDGRATVGIWPTFRVGTGTATNWFRPVNGTPALTTSGPTRAANPEFYLNVNQYQNGGQTRSDRVNWFNNVEYDVTDRITAFADVSYYHSNSMLVRQPILLNAPNADATKAISVDNPFNPFGSRFYSPTGAPNADGTARLTGTPQPLTLLAITLKDLGGEHVVVHSGVYRLVAGLRGKFGEAWTWESGTLYTRAQTSDNSTMAVRESLFAQALQRTDATAFNPFGYTFKVSGGAVVADQPYVNPRSVLDTFVRLWRRDGFSATGSVDFRASGPLFTLWGRTLSAAAGGEYRKEEFGDRRIPFAGLNPAGSGFDPNDNDYILASPKPDSSGQRMVGSAYAEMVAPVVAPQHELPLLRSLELTASARFEHYSDFGNTTKPKFGANWKPFAAVMVRGSVNQGFTAPNLPTLYAPSQFTVSPAPGIVDTYRNPVTNEGPYVQKIYSFGNPKLLPVNSRGKSAGLVVEVPHVKGLTLTADYWQIDQSNVIGSYSTAQILNSDAAKLRDYTQAQLAAGKTIAQVDVGSGTASYKGDPSVVRNAPSAADLATFAAYNASRPAAQQAAAVGTIVSSSSSYQNLAEAFASGWDIGLSYNLPKFSFGRISLSTDWSYLIKTYTISNVAGAAPLLGERLNVDGTTRWRGTGSVVWRKAGWTAGLSAYYIGAFADSGAPTTAANYNTLGAPGYLSKQFDSGGYLYRYVVHDTVTFNGFASHRFGAESAKWLRDASVRVGVTNLGDKQPPLASGSLGFAPSVYGGLFAGRTWSLELTKGF